MISIEEQPTALMLWMDSLSDPTRLRLLRLLDRAELGVDELCEILQTPQSTISRHLKILLDRRWVSSRRQATSNLYRLILDELEPAARRLWLLAREQTNDWASWKQDQLRLAQVLQKRQTDGQSFFATAAGQWDKLRGELYGHSFAAAALAMFLDPKWIVADLGCGTGPMAAIIAPVVKQVIGVDSSAAMLKTARRRLANFENAELRQGDLAAIPIGSGTCHAAMLILTLSYVDDVSAVLAETHRILLPGGRVVAVDLLRHDRDDFRRQMGQTSLGLDGQVMQGMMAEAGFTGVALKALPPHSGAKGPALFVASGRKAD